MGGSAVVGSANGVKGQYVLTPYPNLSLPSQTVKNRGCLVSTPAPWRWVLRITNQTRIGSPDSILIRRPRPLDPLMRQGLVTNGIMAHMSPSSNRRRDPSILGTIPLRMQSRSLYPGALSHPFSII